ncbi:hypothetical protein BJV74DRAFT_988205 [Russula compacta]|nr:hypothetical protein BJV74DRAFT_988205 [Russula compacta]
MVRESLKTLSAERSHFVPLHPTSPRSRYPTTHDSIPIRVRVSLFLVIIFQVMGLYMLYILSLFLKFSRQINPK